MPAFAFACEYVELAVYEGVARGTCVTIRVK